MHTVVGSCPKCGAPIYSQSIWHGIYPPPPIYSCGCVRAARTITATDTANITPRTPESGS